MIEAKVGQYQSLPIDLRARTWDSRLPGSLFTHMSGFIGGNQTYDGARANGKSSSNSLIMRSKTTEVEAIIPTWLIEMRNTDEKTAREVFSEEHKELLRESERWMRSTADSCMLIATIILTVVYAAAFAVPRGNNQETGLPLLAKRSWFTCFFIFEALALFGSTLCIITFWSITSSGFEEDRFLDVLPFQLILGISGLFGSLIGAISAFMSAYCLVFVDKGAWLVKCILVLIYVMLVMAICTRFSELWFKMKLPKVLPRMLSNRKRVGLFSEYDINK